MNDSSRQYQNYFIHILQYQTQQRQSRFLLLHRKKRTLLLSKQLRRGLLQLIYQEKVLSNICILRLEIDLCSLSLIYLSYLSFYADLYFMPVPKRQCRFGQFQDRSIQRFYDTFEHASAVCRNISECIGVWDKECDKQKPFVLCPKGQVRHSTLPSCTHYKIGT